MTKLSKKFAGAVAEGWYAFRTTLSAKPRDKTTHYYQNSEPKNVHRGDVWVTDPNRLTFIWTGHRWKEIKFSARFE